MKIKIAFGIVAIVLITMVPAWWPALAAAAARIVVAQSEQAEAGKVANGKALYARHCSHCHGFNMVSPGTVATDLRQVPRDDKARFVRSVVQGKGGGMPPWGDLLSPDEIDDLWAYVKTGGKE